MSGGSVADEAIFERVARCAVEAFGVEFEGLSAETVFQPIVISEERQHWVVATYRGSDYSFLKETVWLFVLEGEFGIEFEPEEWNDVYLDEGSTLADWADLVQRKLMEKSVEADESAVEDAAVELASPLLARASARAIAGGDPGPPSDPNKCRWCSATLPADALWCPWDRALINRPNRADGTYPGSPGSPSSPDLGFLSKFRQPKTPHPHNSPTPLQPSTPPPEETWPWPNIDRPSVQLLQERAAFHEAGHAVVARCFGIKVIQLSLRLRAGDVGCVTAGATPAWQLAERYDDLRRRADRNPESRRRIPVGVLRPRSLFDYEESLQAELHAILAGAVAEEMQFSSCTGSRSDWRRFHLQVSCCYGNLTGFVSGSTIALLRHRYQNSCQQILARPENWTWVKAVVKAAIRSEHGVLTGDEIDSMRPRRPLPPTLLGKAA